jgi:chemotaxis protein methyltransferase CheR
VSFAYLNLADDAYPCLTNNTGAMDVIFCRNVLMYFSPEIAQKVIRKFFRSLVNGGWLVVSASETSQALFSEFETIQFPGATLYRKNPDASQTAVGVSGVWRLAPQALFPEIMEPIGELNPAPQPRGQMPEPLSPVTGGAPTPETQLSAYDEGLLMYEQGNYAEAAERLCAWLFQNREDANALSLLARVYANQGNLTEARDYFFGTRLARTSTGVAAANTLSGSRLRACPFCPGKSCCAATQAQGIGKTLRERSVTAGDVPGGRQSCGIRWNHSWKVD